jgi:hypothetical protein
MHAAGLHRLGQDVEPNINLAMCDKQRWEVNAMEVPLKKTQANMQPASP